MEIFNELDNVVYEEQAPIARASCLIGRQRMIILRSSLDFEILAM